MRFLTLTLLFLLLAWPVIVLAESDELNGVYYHFSQDDASYTFRGSFFVELTPACLIHVLYDFEHLVKFVTNADSIVLLRQGENWYEVRYTYRGLLFGNKSTYRKTLKQEEQKITFEMIASEQHGPLVPKVLYSTGYYEIKPEKEGCLVEYFQEARVESKMLNEIYFHLVRKEAVNFLKDLKQYVERSCH
jgi:hypothetical protein